MHLPTQFQAKDPAIALELMFAYPLATLISTDDTGFSFATPLPLHVVEEGGAITLLGHVAKQALACWMVRLGMVCSKRMEKPCV